MAHLGNPIPLKSCGNITNILIKRPQTWQRISYFKGRLLNRENKQQNMEKQLRRDYSLEGSPNFKQEI